MTIKRALRLLLLSLSLAMIALLLIFLSLFLYVVLHFSASSSPPEEGSQSGIPCGLVFGAAVHRNSLPGPGISRRVATAARLYKEGILRHIILSGGKGSDDVQSEADVMRRVALQDGIPAQDISVEHASRSTWENLLFSRPLTASCSTVVAISDRYHLARIGYLARAQGWEGLQTLPSDLEAPWYFELKSTFREVAAMMYYIVVTHLFDTNAISQREVSLQPEFQVLGLLINKSIHIDLSIDYLT